MNVRYRDEDRQAGMATLLWILDSPVLGGKAPKLPFMHILPDRQLPPTFRTFPRINLFVESCLTFMTRQKREIGHLLTVWFRE